MRKIPNNDIAFFDSYSMSIMQFLGSLLHSSIHQCELLIQFGTHGNLQIQAFYSFASYGTARFKL